MSDRIRTPETRLVIGTHDTANTFGQVATMAEMVGGAPSGVPVGTDLVLLVTPDATDPTGWRGYAATVDDIGGGGDGEPSLPLVGGTMSGPINMAGANTIATGGTLTLPFNGTPNLQWIDSNNGISFLGTALRFHTGGTIRLSLTSGAASFQGLEVQNIGDPAIATSALNLRTGDARYLMASAPPAVSGDAAGNTALDSLLTALVGIGLITSTVTP